MKEIDKFLTFVLLFGLFVFSPGCGKGDRNFITTPGNYDLSPVSELEVKEKNDCVVLEFKNRNNKIQTFNEHASVHSVWSIYFEKRKKRLWFHSSDVGIFLYTWEEKSGKFGRQTLGQRAKVLMEIPKDFLATLPSSTQSLIEERRNQALD